MACHSGHERLLKQLIKVMKDHNPEELINLLNAEQKQQICVQNSDEKLPISPLHIAIAQDHLAIVKILIKEGSDVTLRHSESELSPLEAAIKLERE